MLCVALLVAAALMASLGQVTRTGSLAPIVAAANQSGVELIGSHSRCQHVAEHSHDLLASMQDEDAVPACVNSSPMASSDPFHQKTTVNPLEYPPRA